MPERSPSTALSDSASRIAATKRANSAGSLSALPTPTEIAPASRNDAALAAVTPPVATNRASGNGPRISSNHGGPSTAAGKAFNHVQPRSNAA